MHLLILLMNNLKNIYLVLLKDEQAQQLVETAKKHKTRGGIASRAQSVPVVLLFFCALCSCSYYV